MTYICACWVSVSGYFNIHIDGSPLFPGRAFAFHAGVRHASPIDGSAALTVRALLSKSRPRSSTPDARQRFTGYDTKEIFLNLFSARQYISEFWFSPFQVSGQRNQSPMSSKLGQRQSVRPLDACPRLSRDLRFLPSTKPFRCGVTSNAATRSNYVSNFLRVKALRGGS